MKTLIKDFKYISYLVPRNKYEQKIFIGTAFVKTKGPYINSFVAIEAQDAKDLKPGEYHAYLKGDLRVFVRKVSLIKSLLLNIQLFLALVYLQFSRTGKLTKRLFEEELVAGGILQENKS